MFFVTWCLPPPGDMQVLPRRAVYTEHGESRTYYAKILRLFFVKYQSYPPPRELLISTKVFYPIRFDTDFETSRDMNTRIFKWTEASGMLAARALKIVLLN